MPGVKRWLFNFAAGVSLMTGMATLMLWIRGNWECDQFGWASENYSISVASANSVILVTFGPLYKGPDAFPQFKKALLYTHYPAHGQGQDYVRVQIPIAKYHQLGWLGFAYDPDRLVTRNRAPKIAYYSSNRLYFPHWFLVAITGVLPSIWWWRWQCKRVRIKPGLCVSCGYDLRATPERCPECGAMAGAAPAKGPVTTK